MDQHYGSATKTIPIQGVVTAVIARRGLTVVNVMCLPQGRDTAGGDIGIEGALGGQPIGIGIVVDVVFGVTAGIVAGVIHTCIGTITTVGIIIIIVGGQDAMHTLIIGL